MEEYDETIIIVTYGNGEEFDDTIVTYANVQNLTIQFNLSRCARI